MCAAKNGVAAREIERKYDLTAKTAWFMLHRIREAMKREPLAGLLVGDVVRRTRRGSAASQRTGTAATARAARRLAVGTDKQPVLSLSTTRPARSAPGRPRRDRRDASAAHRRAGRLDRSARTCTPTTATATGPSAPHVRRPRDGRTTAAGEYVRGDVSTNPAEGYFSQLKRSLDGTHHHVSVEHLERYLAEFDFMYSWCRRTHERMLKGCEQQLGVGGLLPLTADE